MPSDLPGDELRRSLREIERAQREAMPAARALLSRLFNGETDIAGVDRHALLGPISRRRAVTISGVTLATSAILTACYPKKKAPGQVSQTGERNAVGKAPTQVVDDIVLLRTASSLEHLAIAAYDTAIASGLVTTSAIAEAAKLFRDQHAEHAALFEATTVQLGGTAFTTPNPILNTAVLTPALAALKNESDVVVLAHTLESIAAATYQATVGLLADPKLRQAAMNVGGVEARHAAVLAGVIISLDRLPGSAITPALAPVVAATGTTTTVAGSTPVVPVFQVPAPFGSVADSIGPNSYMYVEPKP